MTKTYFDTEFTDFQYADLISVALVSEDGQELYIAITDFKRDLATDFVEDVVLPRIELPEAVPILATKSEAAELVAAFIQGIPDLCLVSDAEIDCTLLRGLLKKTKMRHPKFAVAQNMLDVQKALILLEDLENSLSDHSGRHNALIDARVLKEAMAKLQS